MFGCLSSEVYRPPRPPNQKTHMPAHCQHHSITTRTSVLLLFTLASNGCLPVARDVVAGGRVTSSSGMLLDPRAPTTSIQKVVGVGFGGLSTFSGGGWRARGMTSKTPRVGCESIDVHDQTLRCLKRPTYRTTEFHTVNWNHLGWTKTSIL